MKKFLLLALLVVAFPVAAIAQTHYLPDYQERPIVNFEVVSYPYFLQNRTGAPLVVYVYVDKVRWEFIISPDHEVPNAMLPLGAKVKVEGFADAGKNRGIKKQKVLSAFYHRQERNGKISRGWVFYR